MPWWNKFGRNPRLACENEAPALITTNGASIHLVYRRLAALTAAALSLSACVTHTWAPPPGGIELLVGLVVATVAALGWIAGNGFVCVFLTLAASLIAIVVGTVDLGARPDVRLR